MPADKIPVLIYHHINPHTGDSVTVTPEIFAGQMDFLATEGYQALSVNELMEFIAGNKSFGQKAVAITFDDGWLDNFVYAVPVLETHNFKATFFIISSRADAALTNDVLDSAVFPLHEDAKWMLATPLAGRVAMGWNLIRALEKTALFRFYSHTVTHRSCADLSADELQTELSQSKERIEAELGRSCDYLCWPYGSFRQEQLQTAAGTGYKGLFTTMEGCCESGSDPFMIKRIEVKNSVQWLKNRLSVGCL